MRAVDLVVIISRDALSGLKILRNVLQNIKVSYCYGGMVYIYTGLRGNPPGINYCLPLTSRVCVRAVGKCLRYSESFTLEYMVY